MAAYRHIVLNNGRQNIPRPVIETTTGLKFESINAAATHFGIAEGTITKYACGRAKKPQLSYRFIWVKEDERDKKK